MRDQWWGVLRQNWYYRTQELSPNIAVDINASFIEIDTHLSSGIYYPSSWTFWLFILHPHFLLSFISVADYTIEVMSTVTPSIVRFGRYSICLCITWPSDKSKSLPVYHRYRNHVFSEPRPVQSTYVDLASATIEQTGLIYDPSKSQDNPISSMHERTLEDKRHENALTTTTLLIIVTCEPNDTVATRAKKSNYG